LVLPKGVLPHPYPKGKEGAPFLSLLFLNPWVRKNSAMQKTELCYAEDSTLLCRRQNSATQRTANGRGREFLPFPFRRKSLPVPRRGKGEGGEGPEEKEAERK